MNTITSPDEVVKTYLQKKAIAFKTFEHVPVFTCEEAEKHSATLGIRGLHCKNLFLKERKSKRFYLYILPARQKADLKEVEKITSDEIKFANEEDLSNILGLTKGSVSPFGLINDVHHQTIVLMDRAVWNADFVSFHPNTNTQTLELARPDFHAFMTSVGNPIKMV